jgi:carboxylesterase
VNTQIIPTTEPFFFQGGRTGVLLVHGFTGAPKEMRLMGENLNQHGYTVLGIRLHGHATTPDDMIASRWTDWTASVADGFHLLSNSVDRIFIAGLSMGGALSLYMSTQLNVAGVIAMATPYNLPRDPHYPLWFIRLYSKFAKFTPKVNEKPGSSWYDQETRAKHISYPQNPIRSIVELKILLEEVKQSLPKVTKPVLLIHSKNDAYVSPENMEWIYDGLTNASDKTKVYITESGHVVTSDAARHQVFELAREFIQRIVPQV